MTNKTTPKVSLIVPTKNNQRTIENCLASIKNQTYKNIEIIVVDNYSDDLTYKIAKKFTKKSFKQGPERSAQRNYGAKQASGKFVVFIDSDMILEPEVIADCVSNFHKHKTSIVIPEISFGEGFWAKCKHLERSFYVGVDWIEAARFFSKKEFDDIGGYDENLLGAEDWDLSQRALNNSPPQRIKSYILHDEGDLRLFYTLKKKFYYTIKLKAYKDKKFHNSSNQFSILKRYGLFFSKPLKLFKNPFLGFGMLFMKTSEYAAGVLGIIYYKLKRS